MIELDSTSPEGLDAVVPPLRIGRWAAGRATRQANSVPDAQAAAKRAPEPASDLGLDLDLDQSAPPLGKSRFTNSLKTRLRALASKSGAASSAVDGPAGVPLLVLVGSLQGCSMKDAQSYARGLALKFTMAQDTTWTLVYEDKELNRFVYEIHEGGAGYSIAASLLAALALDAAPVVIELSNGRYAEVADVRGEVSTLIYPQESSVDSQPGIARSVPFAKWARGATMQGFNQADVLLRKVAFGLLVIFSAIFLLVGFWAVVVGSGVLASQPIQQALMHGKLSAGVDGPVPNLNKARAEAEQKSVLILKIVKDSGAWSYTLGKGE